MKGVVWTAVSQQFAAFKKKKRYTVVLTSYLLVFLTGCKKS